MIINNNIPALNTYRQMGVNQAAGSKAMEKLSSGLRINRAGDDAAGLAISEKMRAQIRGLEQASRNAQDGISMIQTAEGALNESHSILQRMRELAAQASNDTNVEVDREEIQKEINQLTSELNRIGNTTEFNTQKILNGGVEAVELAAAANGTGAITFTGAVEEVQGEWTVSIAAALEDGDEVVIGGVTITAADDGTEEINSSTVTSPADQAAIIKEVLEADGNFDAQYIVTDNSDGSLTIIEREGQATGNALTFDDSSVSSGTVTNNQENASGLASDPTLQITTPFQAGDTLTVGDRVITFGNDAENFDIDINVAGDAATQSQAIASLLAQESGIESAVANGDTVTITQAGGAGFTANFQIGANSGQSMTIAIEDMRAEALGVSGTQAGGEVAAQNGEVASYVAIENVTNGTNNENVEFALDVSTSEKASAAISVINDAIETVSAQRSNLGAFQNRLEHTINNLGASAENLQAAESRIRDVDMAKEIMEMTRANILGQASQAMLAQANQQPQSVLQLLG